MNWLGIQYEMSSVFRKHRCFGEWPDLEGPRDPLPKRSIAKSIRSTAAPRRAAVFGVPHAPGRARSDRALVLLTCQTAHFELR